MPLFVPEDAMSEHEIGHVHETAKSACKGCGCGIAASGPPETLVNDPVCGMTVDPATSKHKHDHQGTTYHFCCGGCRSRFKAAPEMFLSVPPT